MYLLMSPMRASCLWMLLEVEVKPGAVTGLTGRLVDMKVMVGFGWAAAVDNGGGYVGDGCNGDGSNQPHTSEFESFLIHIQNGHSENLNAILGSWPNDKKLTFVLTNAAKLEGCITATAS